MARGLNKAMLIGRLGADPEIRYMADGTPVANFNIATDRNVKKGDQWEKETDWHRIVAWRKLAEISGQYLHKGSLVYVEGQIRNRSWTDQAGNKRYITEIIANDMQMLDSKAGASGQPGSVSGYDLEPPPLEDEVPF